MEPRGHGREEVAIGRQAVLWETSCRRPREGMSRRLLRLALRGAVWVRLRGPTAGAAHIKEIFHRPMQKKESKDRAQTSLT